MNYTKTVYVPDDYKTIQSAIDDLPDGSKVIVRPGIYREHLNFNGKDTYVVSEKGREATTIEGVTDAFIVDMESPKGDGILLDGFQIKSHDNPRMINANLNMLQNNIFERTQ